MKKKIGFFVGMMALLLPAALAAQVTITPPTIVSGSVLGAEVEQLINATLEQAARDLETQINTDIQPYIGQDDLAFGFANAGGTAAHIGTQRSFNDYKIFAITVGSGFALSAPSSNPSEIEEAVNSIEDEGDIYFGAATQPIAAALGINMGWFVENLYATVKFGYASFDRGSIADDFSFDSLSVGAMLDYQVFETRRLPLGFLRWRGLTVGSGLIYQRNKSEFIIDFPVEPITNDVALSAPSPVSTLETKLEVEPELTLGASSSSWSIPLEATTGLRILWLLDINIGAGIDLAFGKSDIDISLDSPVTASQNTQLDLQFNEGSVNIDAGTDGDGPQLLRPRLTAGVGLNLGPVKLDVPLMYYFDTEGNSAMVGVNIGIVW